MLIISAKSGQLENRLFLFAHFIAFAIENQYTVFNPAFDEYAEFCQSTNKDILCCYPPMLFTIPGNKKIHKRYYKLNCYLRDTGKFNTINIKRDKPFNWSDSDITPKLHYHRLNFFQGWLFRDGWFIQDIAILISKGFYGFSNKRLYQNSYRNLSFLRLCTLFGIFKQ